MSRPGPVIRSPEVRAAMFWARVNKTESCWPWKGAPIPRGGYGQFYDSGRLRRAHRVAWELANGRALSPDEHVLHRCDAPLCCRPDHLFLGDQALNMADMRAKGRGFTFTTENAEHGTARYNAVLDDDKVRWLRAERIKGRTWVAIADEMGLKESVVKLAGNRHSWKHVS